MPQSPSRSSLDGSKGARNKKRGKWTTKSPPQSSFRSTNDNVF
jgi:hypothetical protein